MAEDDAKYSIPIGDWDAAKEEILGILITIARRGQTISYGELVERVASVHLGANDSRLHAMLAEISRSEDAEGRGLLSSVVVARQTGIPGPGFFRLASQLGRGTSSRFACWQAEYEHVCRFWRSQPDAT